MYKGPKFNETGTLDIRTHIKTTNNCKTSYHPESCKKAIAIGETQRYLTNTQEKTFKEMTNKLTKKLVERGYKPKDISQKYPFHSRDKFLSRDNTHKPEQQPIVVPVKYNDSCKQIRDIINKHWSKISKDTNLNTLFPNKPMLAYQK